MAEKWKVGESYRTADGDHSASTSPYAGVLTDDTWTSYFPDLGVALDRAGVFQTGWGAPAASVLSIPAAWRCITLVSGSLSTMNLGAFKGLRPLEQPNVLAEPVPGEARASTVLGMVTDLLLHGNSFAVLGPRDSRGYISSLVPVAAENVTVGRRDGRVRYRIGEGPVNPDFGPAGLDYLELGREDVFHAKGFARSGELRGQGVLEHHLQAFATAQAQADFARRSFLDAGVPSGKIKVDSIVDADKAAALKAAWMATFAAGRRSPAVLGQGVDFEPLAWSPDNLQMTQARNMSAIDMGRCFGVPAFWLDGEVGGSSLTYTNVVDLATNLVRFTLEPWTTLLEAEFSRLLPRGTDARFNRDVILRAPMRERYETYKVGLEAGFVLVDEVRADESLMPLGDAEQIVAEGPPKDEPVSPLPGTAADQVSNQKITPTR